MAIVARMKLNYKGKLYPFEYNFGEYTTEAAEFMFMEGNYACDCNLSLFLHRLYPEVPEIECGMEIGIEDFEVGDETNV